MKDRNNKIRDAIVIDNLDPDELGGIKVRVYPELMDVEDIFLPWAYPLSSFTSETGESFIPEIGSNIRVIIEDEYWQKLRYTNEGDFVPSKYIYKKLDLSSISELDTQEYPQPKFKRWEDGTVDFHNSDTGEHGTYHKSGSYVIFDKDGKIFINSPKIKIYNGSEDLKSILKSMQNILKGLVTPLNILDGNGLPCIYQNVGQDLPAINQAILNLDALMED